MQYRKLNELKKLPNNPRIIRDKQFKTLCDSIRDNPKYFEARPVILSNRTGELVIIAGNQRYEAAKSLKLKEVPTFLIEGLDEAKEREIIIRDNISNGEFDWDILANEWSDLPLVEWGVDLPEDWLVEEKADPADAEPQIDRAAELNKIWKVKTGDLYQIGEHRLLCGDSTKKEDVGRVMGGEKADLCFTSPPYALGKSVALSGNKLMSKKGNAYNDHNDSSEQWESLMREWFDVSVSAVSDVWVVNMQPLAGNKRQLLRFIADNSERLVDILTWDKGHAAPPMAAGVMASRYEWMIIFSATEGASRSVPLSSWRGTVQNVYAAPPQRGNEFSDIHAATMPVHVPLFVIQTLCDKAISVYEPFCGTGTTMVACQNLNRKCRGIEISPDYCAVILQRMHDAFPGIEINKIK